MKKIIYSLIFSTCILLISCDNKFNDLPQDYYDINDALTDSVFVMGLINDMYFALPDGYNRLGGNSMIASSVDEAVQSGSSSEAQFMALGGWSATTLRDDAWSGSYAAIRKTNVFLNEIYPEIPEKLFRSKRTVDRLVGQTYFLRAFFYFELVKRYGGVPIITDILGIDDGTDIFRDNYDDCIDFIVGQCDTAAAILPLAWENATNDFGRATKGAALALKSKVLLYAASPLFNDPSKPQNTPEHGAFSNEKWKKAAQAAYDVISLNAYQLNSDYEKFFTTLNNNKEFIFGKMKSKSNDVEMLNGPTGFTEGKGGSCPSLDLVDAYQMNDGTSFDWNNPAHAQDPFINREPRFYASVLYNGAAWMGSVIQTYEGGKDMGNVNSTKTGFYLKKFMSEDAQWFGGSPGSTIHCFPFIRYAEILLNYAEAMNEAYNPEDPGTFGLTALSAVNQVRTRANVTLLPTGLSKSVLRERIQHERQIELSFEEHRHLDIRRWKLAESVFGKPVSGLKIIAGEGNSFTYEKKIAQNRVFRPEMYLYPIPQSEINRNSNLVQNQGW
jgi:hypothetical protein